MNPQTATAPLPRTQPAQQDEPVGQRVTKYNAVPYLVLWLKAFYQIIPGSCLPKNELYKDYIKFCFKNNIETTSTGAFGKIVRIAFADIKCTRRGPRGKTKHYYKNFGRKTNSFVFGNEPAGNNTQEYMLDDDEEEEDDDDDYEDDDFSPPARSPRNSIPSPVSFQQNTNSSHLFQKKQIDIPDLALKSILQSNRNDYPLSPRDGAFPHRPTTPTGQNSMKLDSPTFSSTNTYFESHNSFSSSTNFPYSSLNNFSSIPEPISFSHGSVVMPSPQEFKETVIGSSPRWPRCPEFVLNVDSIPATYLQHKKLASDFSNAYHSYFQSLYEDLLKIQLNKIQEHLFQFWGHVGKTYQNLWIHEGFSQQLPYVDFQIYRSLLETVISNPFQDYPVRLSSGLLEFIKQYPTWLLNATAQVLPSPLVEAKMKAVNAFCDSLKIRATITLNSYKLQEIFDKEIFVEDETVISPRNFISTSPRSPFFSSSTPPSPSLSPRSPHLPPQPQRCFITDIMFNDWMKLNIGYLNSQLELFSKSYNNNSILPCTLLKDIASLLQANSNTQCWNEWIHSTLVMPKILFGASLTANSSTGSNLYESYQFLLKWNFYVSQILANFNFIHSSNLGHFHTLFCWIEAILFYYIEKQESTLNLKKHNNGFFTFSPRSSNSVIFEIGELNKQQCCLMEASPRDLELPSPRTEYDY